MLSLVIFEFLFAQLGGQIWNLSMDNLRATNFTEMTVAELHFIKFVIPASGVAFIVASFVCLTTFREKAVEYLTLLKLPSLGQLIIVLLLFIGSVPLQEYLIGLNSSIELSESIAKIFTELQKASENIYSAVLRLNSGGWILVNLLIMAVLPALGEELFFRGLIQKKIGNGLQNMHIGILISSLLFALIHFQPYHFLPMLLLSFILGYIYFFTGKLWLSILFHAVNNAMVVLFDAIKKSDTQDLDAISFPWYITFASAVFVAVLFIFAKKRQSIQTIPEHVEL